MRNKVSCHNCVYQDRISVFLGGGNICVYVDRNKFTGNRTNKKFRITNNSKGACKYYKRIWWKFWIKENKNETDK